MKRPTSPGKKKKTEPAVDPFPGFFTNLIPLPRVAKVGSEVMARDAHVVAICETWGAQLMNLNGDDEYSDYRLPDGWHVRVPLKSAMRELVDGAGNVRAHIIDRSRIDYGSVLQILPRYYVSIESDDAVWADRMRVSVVDRVGSRRIRVSRWVPTDQVDVRASIEAEFTVWLDEIRPGHRDPFAHW